MFGLTRATTVVNRSLAAKKDFGHLVREVKATAGERRSKNGSYGAAESAQPKEAAGMVHLHAWATGVPNSVSSIVQNLGPLPKQLLENVHQALATGVMQSVKEGLTELLWDEEERQHLPVSACTQAQMDLYMELLDGAAAEAWKAALAEPFSPYPFHRGSLAAVWAEEYYTLLAARVATLQRLLMALIQPIGPLLKEMHVERATGPWIDALSADPLTLRWLLRGLAGGACADVIQHPRILAAVFSAGCLIRRERIAAEKQVTASSSAMLPVTTSRSQMLPVTASSSQILPVTAFRSQVLPAMARPVVVAAVVSSVSSNMGCRPCQAQEKLLNIIMDEGVPQVSFLLEQKLTGRVEAAAWAAFSPSNRAIISRSSRAIILVMSTRKRTMLLLAMLRTLAARHCTVPQSTLALPSTSSSAGNGLKETSRDDTKQRGGGLLGAFISKLAARMKAGIKGAASLARHVSSVLRGLLGFGHH